MTNKQEALEAVLMRVRKLEARGVTGISQRRITCLRELVVASGRANEWVGRTALKQEGMPLQLSEALAEAAALALHLLIDEPDSVGGRTLAEWLDGVEKGSAAT